MIINTPLFPLTPLEKHVEQICVDKEFNLPPVTELFERNQMIRHFTIMYLTGRIETLKGDKEELFNAKTSY